MKQKTNKCKDAKVRILSLDDYLENIQKLGSKIFYTTLDLDDNSYSVPAHGSTDNFNVVYVAIPILEKLINA